MLNLRFMEPSGGCIQWVKQKTRRHYDLTYSTTGCEINKNGDFLKSKTKSI